MSTTLSKHKSSRTGNPSLRPQARRRVMFAYLLIGIELTILYAVFWYVFIREPRPYKVDGNMWGTYDYSQTDLSRYEIDYSSSADRKWLENNLEILKGLQNASTATHQVHLPMKPVENTRQYGWVVRNSESEANAVAKLFGKFRNSVDTLSVKTP